MMMHGLTNFKRGFSLQNLGLAYLVEILISFYNV
jgi:hypothetical protein